MVLSGALLLATSSTTRAVAAGADTVRLHSLSIPHAPSVSQLGISAPAGAPQSSAQAPSAKNSPPCTDQHGLNNPTTSNSQMLDSYQFTIQHAGTTTTVCNLGGNVHPGDVVTASFVVHDNAAVEVTLVVDTFAAANSTSQLLSQCASFSSVADSGGDACSTSATPSLTVTVPQCGFQIDLVYGEPLAALTTGAYADARVWINGMAGDRSGGCPGVPVASLSPTPSSAVLGATSSGSGGRSASTPDTGWAPTSAQGILGIALVVSGSAALVASRPRSSGGTPQDGRRRRASGYPRIFRG